MITIHRLSYPCQLILAIALSLFSQNILADPLVEAAYSKNAKVVQSLLNHGHDVDAADSEQYTALVAAAEVGDLNIVKLLIENGADLNRKTNEGANALHKVLDAERPPNKKLNKERVSIALLLINNGIDINAKGFNDTTALHLAALRGDIPILKALLKKGADKNAKTKKGMTPHYIAKAFKNRQAAKLLEQ